VDIKVVVFRKKTVDMSLFWKMALFRKKAVDMKVAVFRKKAVDMKVAVFMKKGMDIKVAVFRKKAVDVEDVKRAVQMQCEQNNTSPPSREVLLELSQFRYLRKLTA
jgi:hypothetical protein